MKVMLQEGLWHASPGKVWHKRNHGTESISPHARIFGLQSERACRCIVSPLDEVLGHDVHLLLRKGRQVLPRLMKVPYLPCALCPSLLTRTKAYLYCLDSSSCPLHHPRWPSTDMFFLLCYLHVTISQSFPWPRSFRGEWSTVMPVFLPRRVYPVQDDV